MRKGTITKKRLLKIKDMIEDPELLDTWVDRLQHEEPDFYEWMHKMTGKVISDMGNHIEGFNMKIAERVAHIFLMSFITGWIVYKDISDEYINTLMDVENETDKFQKWLDGKLSEEHYDYSLRGIKKDSTKYQAKKAYLLIKKEKEHRKAFFDICKGITKKENNTFLGKFKEDDDGKKHKRTV